MLHQKEAKGKGGCYRNVCVCFSIHGEKKNRRWVGEKKETFTMKRHVVDMVMIIINVLHHQYHPVQNKRLGNQARSHQILQ